MFLLVMREFVGLRSFWSEFLDLFICLGVLGREREAERREEKSRERN